MLSSPHHPVSLALVLLAAGVVLAQMETSPPAVRSEAGFPRMTQRGPDRQQRKKCTRDIQFCTRQNIDVFGLFVQTVLSIDVKRVKNDEAHQITENLCITFRPIFECVERRNASWCSVPLSQTQPTKFFHISYFVLVCELTKIWRECAVVGNTIEGGSRVTSVCNDHFPALNREAEQLRLLNNPLVQKAPPVALAPAPAPAAILSSAAAAASSAFTGERQSSSFAAAAASSQMMADQQSPVNPSIASMEFILLNITESHCEDIMMFAGCQLHWTRSICGNKAYEIVRRLFAAYNDMSGKKCSGHHELQEVDFEALERKYTERYLYLSGGASAKASNQVTSRVIISEVVSTAMQPQQPPPLPIQQQATREAVDPPPPSSIDDAQVMTKQQLEYGNEGESDDSRQADSGPLNSSAARLLPPTSIRHRLVRAAVILTTSSFALLFPWSLV